MKANYLFSGLIALIVTATTLGLFTLFQGNKEKTIKIEQLNSSPDRPGMLTLNKEGEVVPLDFTKVAAKVMDAVVHIRSTQSYSNPNMRLPFEDFFKDSPFRDFFFPKESPEREQEPQFRIGQGSGVIISGDGYIVTNNHVVANSKDLEVTLHDNRQFKASIVGTDPSTDLALIQIKAKDLTTIPFVDSDKVLVGEWVMAVGNPFNLTSTVTAGIVSAKGRNINILREKFAIESFIQTDAAINPGNSGGALVSLEGGLIGINTAIASPTGTYSGYGFAIPANIASKVVEDLIQYGVVQRAVLGVMIRTIDANLKKEKNLSVLEGAYVDSLLANSAAGAAGIQIGDVIVAIDDTKIESSPGLQEFIARHRPGDKIKVKVNRKGKEKEIIVTLSNRQGNTELVEEEEKTIMQLLGAELETLDSKTAKELKLKGGVSVKKILAGKLSETNMREGFIITKVDDRPVNSVEDLLNALEKKKGGVMLAGVYKDIPGEYFYAFGM